MAGSFSLVVAGPSGVGKSTLINLALQQKPQWMFSVSATTRPIRAHETDGREYHFLTREKFLEHIAKGDLLEYAEVYGNLYGTLRSEFTRARELKRHLLIEVDTVGCLSIRAVMPDVPLLAILPPSIALLKQRLAERNTESEDSLALRYANIHAELQRMRSFEFGIVNDDLEVSLQQMLAIMKVIEDGQMQVAPRIDWILKEAGETNETATE